MGRHRGRRPFVIAVDSGGTHTRAGCFALTGELLGQATGRGGSPQHNHDARENLVQTVLASLGGSELRIGEAVALAAGVAGVGLAGPSGPGDDTGPGDLLEVPGLDCPRVVVNDAVVAHRGAMGGAPGIIVVAGTGSTILAITEQGEEIESGHLQHYAGGARHLVFDVVERLLTSEPFPSSDPLARATLRHWEVADEHQLRRRLVDTAAGERNELKRRFGGLAPSVTALAGHSPVADAAVRHLAAKTAQGIRLLRPLIGRTPTPVALADALATDRAFVDRLRDDLASTPAVQLVEPLLDPLAGAAVTALEAAGVPVDGSVLDRLARPPGALCTTR